MRFCPSRVLRLGVGAWGIASEAQIISWCKVKEDLDTTAKTQMPTTRPHLAAREGQTHPLLGA